MGLLPGGVWKYQWTAQFAPLTRPFRPACTGTRRIHALVVRLFQLAQLRAIRDGTECLSEALIDDVALSKFKLVAPMLEALRTGDKKAIEQYEDLLNKGLTELSEDVESAAKLALLKAQAQSRNQSSAERLHTVSALIAMGFEQDRAQEVVNSLRR